MMITQQTIVLAASAWTWLGLMLVTVVVLKDKGYSGLLALLLYLIAPLPMLIYAIAAPFKTDRKRERPGVASEDRSSSSSALAS